MTTFATQPETERRIAEIEACKRGAWAAYRENLVELKDQAYEDAEPVAWDRLRAVLRELDAERAQLTATGVTR